MTNPLHSGTAGTVTSVHARDQFALDPGALATLRDLFDGDPAAMGDLVETYLQSSKTLCDDIGHGCRDGNFVAISRAAHTLKSSSAIFGASQLATTCRELEAAANRADLAAITALAADLAQAYAQAHAAIAALADLPATT